MSRAYVRHRARHAALGIDLAHLPAVYLVTGISTLVVAPLVGRLADRIGKLPVFFAGSAVTVTMVALYTRLDSSPLIVLMAVSRSNILISKPARCWMRAAPCSSRRLIPP